MGKPLVVIGEGDQQAELCRIAGPTIRFLNRVDDVTLQAITRGAGPSSSPAKRISELSG